MRFTQVSSVAIPVLAGLLCAIATGCSRQPHGTVRQSPASAQQADGEQQKAELIRRGKLIFDETPKYAFHYVGNKLACGDCHLKSGTAFYAAPMINLSGAFPAYSKRAGHVISLQNRIQECFARSEAGRPLPEDSPEMRALVAYIDSLSKDGEKGKPYAGRGLVKLPALTGDPVRGKAVYTRAECAICHGQEGAGIPPIMPPVWGPGSYNDGAGMNNPAKMAAFVIHNMPQNQPGILTPQEAYDVSAYVHSMPRPKLNPAYKNY